MTTECSLCSATGDVAVGLVEYARPVTPGKRFEDVPRCRDRAACRARVEAEGLPWPLVSTTAELLALAEPSVPPEDTTAAPVAVKADAPPEEDLLDLPWR